MLVLASPSRARDAASFELVFVPESGAADYVITLREISAGRRDGPRSVSQRAGRTRTEIAQPDGKQIIFESRSLPNAIVLNLDAKGRYRELQIDLGGDATSSATQRIRTDKLQTFLNETCRVWNITYRIDAHTRMQRESCVTQDGIELWHKLLSQGGILLSYVEATSLERRPITDAEILPSANLLNLESWGVTDKRDWATVPRPVDFETTFRLFGAEPKSTAEIRKTVRRNFPWLRTETTADRYRRVEFKHDPASLHLDFRGERTSAFNKLRISRYDSAFDEERVAQKMDLAETIVGERCDWFDLRPGIMDANWYQCRSKDGIVLKETLTSMGSRTTFEAVELRRATASIPVATPPDEILLPAYWRIAQ